MGNGATRAPFEWTSQRAAAAALLAADELTDEEIARRVGICRRTLSYWKDSAEFWARVDAIVQSGFAEWRRSRKR